MSRGIDRNLQKKIFTRYCNQKYREAGSKTKIEGDLLEEFKDSVKLIELTEILSGQDFGPKRPKPSTQKIHRVDAAKQCIDFMKKCKIKVDASAENIIDGNEIMVLGLVFQVIIKYMKFDDDDDTSGDVKEALKLWLNNRTAGYKSVKIENFTKSFHNGLPFLALIHKMRPKLVPNPDECSESEGPKNLEIALNAAEKYCNVEKYLTPADIPKLDEISSIVYLADWYYGIALLQKQDIAARRIAKLVTMTELHDKMRKQYIDGANQLDQDLKAKIPELENLLKFDDTLAGIQQRIETFYKFKTEEKSKFQSAHLDLVALFNNLALRLANNKRPPFQPPANCNLDALDKMFDDLEKIERDLSVKLHDELARQLKLHKMGRRWNNDVTKLKGFVQQKEQFFKQEEQIDSVDTAEEALEENTIESNELANTEKGRWAELKKTAAYLYSERFEKTPELKQTEGEVDGYLKDVNNLAQAKQETLAKKLEEQKTINDNLCKDFAKVVNDFNSWLLEKKKLLAENKDVELEDQLDSVVKSLKDTSEAETKLKEVNEADKKVKARQITNNPHTQLTAQDMTSNWNQYQVLLQKKKDLLENAIEEKKKQGLTEDQIKEIEVNFQYFDKDKSGALDRRELRSCLQSLGEESSPKDVQKVLDTYDTDKNGKITFDEFKQFMMKQLGDSNSEEEIIQSFKYLSLDKEFITAEQLSAVVNEISFKTHHVEYLQREMKPKDSGYDYPTWTHEVFLR